MNETIIVVEDDLTILELEELLDHAEENLTAVILATAAFAKERGFAFSDWVNYVSASVAPTWDDTVASGPMDLARLAALNFIASGGHVHALDGDDTAAVLNCTWPEAEDLEYFGLSRSDMDPFFNAYQPIAEQMGLNFQPQREGDVVTLVFSR
jgi:hypothetical protein